MQGKVTVVMLAVFVYLPSPRYPGLRSGYGCWVTAKVLKDMTVTVTQQTIPLKGDIPMLGYGRTPVRGVVGRSNVPPSRLLLAPPGTLPLSRVTRRPKG